ncbi:MAG TPA: right-handed parallel beta-helix repeat-containing protein [Ferruginibacter sp.]|jgi:predicted outer membrane repeat protein|nr:right-handed parallel beta-helix repeat-containing protein [Ferruginibacter sp.]
MRRSLPIIILFSCFLSITCSAHIIYVKYNATGTNDGSSWANAYTSLMSAIPYVGASDSVWVAAGTYTPVPVTASTSFFISTGTFIGHFAGNETKVSDRDLQNAAYETILSGQSVSYHVINGSGSFQLDGFTISGANANGDLSYLRSQGGGILYSESSGTISLSNCILKNNYAAQLGSAIFTFFSHLTLLLKKCTFENDNNYAVYIPDTNTTMDSCEFNSNPGAPLNISGSSLQLTNCSFSNNGSAMILSSMTSPTIITNCQFTANIDNSSADGTIDAYSSNTPLEVSDCIFEGNAAVYGGAVIVNEPSIFTNCLFNNNTAASYGGAVFATDNIGCKFINCAFSNNSSYFSGGAVSANTGELSFINCTFYNNNATGGTLGINVFSGSGGAIYGNNATLDITNSIFWKNKSTSTDSSQLQVTGNKPIKISHSLVQGGCPFNAICSSPIIISDPLFVNPALNNFTLAVCSPAINMGLNDSVPSNLTIDLAGNSRILDQIVDMGAYESHGVAIDSFTKNVIPASSSFSSTDFSSHYSDPSGTLQKIKIISLPDNGILKLNGVLVVVDTIIAVSNISQLSFVADSCTNSTSFLWSGASTVNNCSFYKSAVVNLVMANNTIYSRPSAPMITAAGAVTFCLGDSVTLASSTGYDGYLWSNNDSDNIIEAKISGIYTVQGENHHCYSKASDTIIVVTKPVPLVNYIDGSRCLAGATSVSVTGGTTYSWYADSMSTSPIATGNIYNFTNLAQTDTLYVIAQTNGCYSNRYPIVTYIDSIPPKPIVSGNDCEGTVTLTVQNYADYLYTWYESDGITATRIRVSPGNPTVSIVPAVTQNDSIFIIQANGIGACINADTVKLTIASVPPTPTVTYNGSLTKCFPDSVQLFGPAGYDQYIWSIYQADTSFTTTSNLNQLYVTKSSTILLAVKNSAGCISTSFIFPPPTAYINIVAVPSIIKNGDSLVVDTSYTSYQWYANGSNINGATSNVYIPAANGSYTVRVTDQNGCDTMSGIIVFTLPVPPPEDTARDSLGNIVVYPNPSSGYVTVTFPSTIKQISVYNSIGQRLQTKYVEGETSTGFVLTNSDVYLVKLITNDGKTVVKKAVIGH